MKKNMGTVDRLLRMVIAIVLGVLCFMNIIPGTLGLILFVVAIVFFGTSLIGFCPAYLPFGISTCKKE